MSVCAEIEQEKGGRWVAKMPGVPELSGYGSTRHEAAVGLTVRALRILADRVESGQLEVEDEPAGIRLTCGGEVFGILAALLDASAGHIPNAETIAAIKELESGEGESCDSIEELIARLNAD